MKKLRVFSPTAVALLALALLASACGIGRNNDGDADLSTSSVRVVVSTLGDGCNVAKANYPIEIGGRSSWKVKILVTREKNCLDTDLTVQPDHVDASDAGLIRTDTISHGPVKDDVFYVTLAAGTFRLLVNGNPTEVTFTVTKGSGSTTTSTA